MSKQQNVKTAKEKNALI